MLQIIKWKKFLDEVIYIARESELIQNVRNGLISVTALASRGMQNSFYVTLFLNVIASTFFFFKLKFYNINVKDEDATRNSNSDYGTSFLGQILNYLKLCKKQLWRLFFFFLLPNTYVIHNSKILFLNCMTFVHP